MSYSSREFVSLTIRNDDGIDINGTTVHSQLWFYGNFGNMPLLTREAKRNFQRDFQNARFIFVDECSMIGVKCQVQLTNDCVKQKHRKKQSEICLCTCWVIFSNFCRSETQHSIVQWANSKLQQLKKDVLFLAPFKAVIFRTCFRQSLDQQVFRDILNRIAGGATKVND